MSLDTRSLLIFQSFRDYDRILVTDDVTGTLGQNTIVLVRMAGTDRWSWEGRVVPKFEIREINQDPTSIKAVYRIPYPTSLTKVVEMLYRMARECRSMQEIQREVLDMNGDLGIAAV